MLFSPFSGSENLPDILIQILLVGFLKDFLLLHYK